MNSHSDENVSPLPEPVEPAHRTQDPLSERPTPAAEHELQHDLDAHHGATAVGAEGHNDNDGHKPDTHVADGLGEVLKRDWEQTKADLPGLKGKDTGQTIGDTLHGDIHDTP